MQDIQTTHSGDNGGTTESLEQLEIQKAQIEEDERVAEEELETDLAEDATLFNAEEKVNETEAFVEQLTTNPTPVTLKNRNQR